MKKNSNIISGLDIQKEYMCFAQYSANDNAVLLVAIQPLALIDSSDIGSQIVNDLKELKEKSEISNVDVVCSIPSQYAVVKNIPVEITETNPEAHIEWELSQQLIGSIDEYVFDFQNSGFRSDNIEEYLAVAYRKSLVNGVASSLKNVKFNPLVVDLDIFALINVFEANYRELSTHPTIIIHSESDRTKMVLTINGLFIDHEYLLFPAGSMDPAGFSERIKMEIERLLSLNKSKVGDNGIGIFFAGSLFSRSEYAETLIGVLGGGEILNPFKNIQCRAGIDEGKLKAYASQLAVAVGLAYRGND
jgi:Tfp pilus assembly PilM family ATPase